MDKKIKEFEERIESIEKRLSSLETHTTNGLRTAFDMISDLFTPSNI